MGALRRLAVQVDRLSVTLDAARDPLRLPDRGTPPRPEPPRPAELHVEPRPRTPTPAPTSAREPTPTPRRQASPPPAPKPAPPSLAPTEPATATATDEAAAEPVGLRSATHLRRRLDPQLAALRAGNAWASAQDPADALRRTRVATRRLRAFVRLFAPAIGNKRSRKLHRRLRRITRAIGPLRQYDALIEDLYAVHGRASDLSRAALEHVIAGVQSERARALPDTAKLVDQTDLGRLADDVENELDRICGRLLGKDETWLPEVWPLLKPQLDRAFTALPGYDDIEDVEGLHEIRIRAKALRYALELVRPALGDAYKTLRKPAKAIQRALGDHHDHTLLMERLQLHDRALRELGLTTLADALGPLIAELRDGRAAAYARARPILGLFDRARYQAIARHGLGLPEPASNDDLPTDAGPRSEEPAGL